MNEGLAHRQQIERDYHNNRNKVADDRHVTVSMDFADYSYVFYMNLMGQFAHGRVLDFGCGDGWASIMLAKKGCNVYGIDISLEMINKARNMAQDLGLSHNAVFEEMAGEHLTFNDDFFDSVFGSAVLHHTDLDMALNGIHRVLKPGGTGLFIEPMNQNILLKMWRAVTPWRRSTAERALTLHEICLIREKFPAARFTYFNLFSIFSGGLIIIFPKSNLLRQINQVLQNVDEILVKRFPKLGRYCAVVVIELVKR